jgi:hypothetical protein
MSVHAYRCVCIQCLQGGVWVQFYIGNPHQCFRPTWQFVKSHNHLFSRIMINNLTNPSNLEDSHVIPGLIHKCYLAKSIYVSPFLHLFLHNNLQRTTPHLLCLALESLCVNSSILTISRNYLYGCSGNTTTSSLLFSRVSPLIAG